MAAKIRKPQSKVRLNVVLGKSPGQTLRKFGHRAYTLESQKQLCISTFNYKYGVGRWTVDQWFIRDVSARVSKAWPVQLKKIIEDTQEIHGTLASATVDRMLRTARDWMMVQDSKVPVLICDDSNLDTTTPAGKNNFGKKALDAEKEAEECGERVKRALTVAKRRGKKLGSHHPRTKGKSARGQHKRAMQKARDLLPHCVFKLSNTLRPYSELLTCHASGSRTNHGISWHVDFAPGSPGFGRSCRPRQCQRKRD